VTDITKLAQLRDELSNPAVGSKDHLRKLALSLIEALEKAQQRIEELESDLSEWTDCKHDGATYYDMSGRERCARCGADI
jgi:DNA repair exonuclease SbcCD ATPase subunit